MPRFCLGGSLTLLFLLARGTCYVTVKLTFFHRAPWYPTLTCRGRGEVSNGKYSTSNEESSSGIQRQIGVELILTSAPEYSLRSGTLDY